MWNIVFFFSRNKMNVKDTMRRETSKMLREKKKCTKLPAVLTLGVVWLRGKKLVEKFRFVHYRHRNCQCAHKQSVKDPNLNQAIRVFVTREFVYWTITVTANWPKNKNSMCMVGGSLTRYGIWTTLVSASFKSLSYFDCLILLFCPIFFPKLEMLLLCKI